MANNFAPTVTVKNTNVEIGASVLLKDLFDVVDLDGNAITRYRFRDNGSAAYSGFFSIGGVKQNSGGWIEITAAQLNSVSYSAALLLDAESIGIQAYDGKFWSSAAFGVMSTVQPNNRPPIVTTQNGQVLETEFRSITDLISVYDPDDYPITKYSLVDRDNFAISGYFTLRGNRLPSAQWNVIDAADLSAVRYIGGEWGPVNEKIGVMAYDGKKWSEVSEFTMLTTPNLNSPVVGVYNLQGGVGRVIDAQTMFTVSDADGNTIKKIRFLDTGINPNSGFFTINGVRQTSGTFFELPYNQLSTVRYNYSAFPEFEQYQIQAFDGRYWSDLAVGNISAVVQPTVTFDTRTVVLDTLEEVKFNTLFERADAGPPLIQYQVVDFNTVSTSANLTLNGARLTPGRLYSLSAAEFDTLRIEGAVTDDGTSYDSMMVRGYNGTFWTDWEKIDVNTEPVGTRALEGGPEISPREVVNGKVKLTYTFIEGFNPSSPPYPPLPIYYGPDDPEADQTTSLAPSQRAVVRDVMAYYESITNIDFVEVPFTADASEAMTTIGLCNIDGPGGTLAYVYGGTQWYGSKPGDFWLDIGDFPVASTDTRRGALYRLTVIHELGHLLGLKHPFEGDPRLPVATDHRGYTVMSYASPAASMYQNPNPALTEPATPMLYDIGRLHETFGANTNFRTGNDTYVFEQSDNILQALWDAGGDDTLNYGNQVLPASIDLREGRRSSLNGVANALLLPYGSVIENARGSRSNDVITGNQLRNLLFGNEGNDRLIGNGGEDVLRGGAGNDTYFWSRGDGNDVVREETQSGREIIEIADPFGQLNALQDDFTFRRFGRDLRIDIAFDRGEALGSVVVKDMAWGGSRVETLRFVDSAGNRIGNDIDLNSIFVQSTDVRQRFQLSSSQTQFGFIATPV
ncbi:MAG: M10 family metallopeptidase [Planctomycetota bacterium]